VYEVVGVVGLEPAHLSGICGAEVNARRASEINELRRQLHRRFPSSRSSQKTKQPCVTPHSLAAGKGPWPTGMDSIDHLLPGGGFPGGRLSEISGGRSSGKTSIALSAAAQATRVGHPVAWVDMAHTLYPPSAAAIGVDLDRLLIIRPDNVIGGLKAIDILIRGRAFPLIVLDWGLDPQKKRALLDDIGTAFARLNGLLSMGNETLLAITSHTTARDPIRYYATVRLGVERVPWSEVVRVDGLSRPAPATKAGSHLRLVTASSKQRGPGLTRTRAPNPRYLGQRTAVSMVKNKLGPPGATGEVGFGGWQKAVLPLHPGFPTPGVAP